MVTVQSGDRSLRSREHGETFHPVVGPMTEARALYVVQQRLVERAKEAKGSFVIWDVGLGAAANAIAAIEALGEERAVIHSFDRSVAPLAFALRHAAELVYLWPHRAAVSAVIENRTVRVGGVEWRFHGGDFGITMEDSGIAAPHALLYDPYSPTTNADMWTLEHFSKLYSRLDPRRPCLLTNYTRSTAVRVTLLLAGFYVGRGHATGEKDETTSAANDPSLVPESLDEAWLRRVARSTRSAPLRRGTISGPISAEDLSRLHAHPQFKLGS